eukprot:COSAG01_NODE_11053_length_2019_cov_18.345609_3_plen_173_part_00
MGNTVCHPSMRLVVDRGVAGGAVVTASEESNSGVDLVREAVRRRGGCPHSGVLRTVLALEKKLKKQQEQKQRQVTMRSRLRKRPVAAIANDNAGSNDADDADDAGDNRPRKRRGTNQGTKDKTSGHTHTMAWSGLSREEAFVVSILSEEHMVSLLRPFVKGSNNVGRTPSNI